MTEDPGCRTDIAARNLADKMGTELGRPSSSTIGRAPPASSACRRISPPPDGHTILTGNIGPNAISYALDTSLPCKPEDMIPIALESEESSSSR